MPEMTRSKKLGGTPCPVHLDFQEILSPFCAAS
jgi:hypothetical protein